LYERSTTDRIRNIHQVIEAAAPRWTFEGRICDAAGQVLAALRHNEDDQMEHSQYQHFLSRACKEDDAEVLPVEGHDCMGCLPDQVKLIGALNQGLDEAMKEICQLSNHGEEANRSITELETLYKQDGEAVEKLKKENATLEGMV
jgi:hypothetical protein